MYWRSYLWPLDETLKIPDYIVGFVFLKVTGLVIEMSFIKLIAIVNRLVTSPHALPKYTFYKRTE